MSSSNHIFGTYNCFKTTKSKREKLTYHKQQSLYSSSKTKQNAYEQYFFQVFTRSHLQKYAQHLKRRRMECYNDRFNHQSEKIIPLIILNNQTMTLFKIIDNIIDNEDVSFDTFPIQDAGLQYIINSHTRNIRMLNLNMNCLTPRGLVHFNKGKWDSLIQLSLQGNKIGDKGCKFLTRAQLNCIKGLDLARNQIGSYGIIHISKAKWSKLQVLGLSYNKISASSISFLNRSNWKAITQIFLYDNHISEEQMMMLVLFKANQLIEIVLWNNLVQDSDRVKMYPLFLNKFHLKSIQI